MRVLIAAGCAAALSVPAVSPALADPVVDGQFPVSGLNANNQITPGPDGAMWVTLDSATKDVARIAPDGTVTEYDAATMTKPVGITAGPDGNLWVTQANGVARFSPADPASAQQFAIAAIADPHAITAGPDGSLWTASLDKVVRIPPATPNAPQVFSTTGVSGARWITTSSDGFLWVSDFGVAQVVRVATDGTAQAFPIGGGSQGIAGGPNGQVAYSQQGGAPNYIGRLTAGTEARTETPGQDPFGVTFAADGAYWVAQTASGDLGRLTPAGTYSTLALPPGSKPRHLAAGPGNTVWVTLEGAPGTVVRVSGVAPAPGGGATAKPTTKLTKKPAKKRTIETKRAKVQFRFTGTGDSFECRLNKRAWRECTSPKTYRLTPGKYRFRVRAVLDQQTDPTPATWRFRIKR